MSARSTTTFVLLGREIVEGNVALGTSLQLREAFAVVCAGETVARELE